MSSDMKDARWGLAMAMSQDDGADWYAMDYVVKEGYLRVAQDQLDMEPETIPRWANEFRREDEDYDPKWDDVHHGEMIW